MVPAEPWRDIAAMHPFDVLPDPGLRSELELELIPDLFPDPLDLLHTRGFGYYRGHYWRVCCEIPGGPLVAFVGHWSHLKRIDKTTVANRLPDQIFCDGDNFSGFRFRADPQ